MQSSPLQPRTVGRDAQPTAEGEQANARGTGARTLGGNDVVPAHIIRLRLVLVALAIFCGRHPSRVRVSVSWVVCVAAVRRSAERGPHGIPDELGAVPAHPLPAVLVRACDRRREGLPRATLRGRDHKQRLRARQHDGQV